MIKRLVSAALAAALCVSAFAGNEEFKKWAPTPPMGWNSWDCYGPTVTEDEVKANADYMAENLKEYGWEYVVVDIRWFVANDKAGGYNQTDPIYSLDEYGRYIPAVNRFPSSANGKGFKELADYVHSKGLKFGIHIMRGVPKVAVEKKMPILGTDGITADKIHLIFGECEWLHDNWTINGDKKGAQEYYNSIFDLYASWGVDFVKVDDLSAPVYHREEVDMIRKAIDQCGRPIVLSTSPGDTPSVRPVAEHVRSHANMWRMVNDVWDSWWHVQNVIKVAHNWYKYRDQGAWPDCDMIPLGHLSVRGERGEERQTNLTEKEQYSLMTFWTIFRSPLMFGGTLTDMDQFTLSLLTNKEVLRMHREATEVKECALDQYHVTVASKNPETGECYVAIINISDEEGELIVSFDPEAIGKTGRYTITDLWTGKSLGTQKGFIQVSLKAHESVLYKLD